jgi:hypothetical protein
MLNEQLGISEAAGTRKQWNSPNQTLRRKERPVLMPTPSVRQS